MELRLEAVPMARERARRDVARPQDPAAGIAERDRDAVARRGNPVGDPAEQQEAARRTRSRARPPLSLTTRSVARRVGDARKSPRRASPPDERELVVDVGHGPCAEGLRLLPAQGGGLDPGLAGGEEARGGGVPGGPADRADERAARSCTRRPRPRQASGGGGQTPPASHQPAGARLPSTAHAAKTTRTAEGPRLRTTGSSCTAAAATWNRSPPAS